MKHNSTLLKKNLSKVLAAALLCAFCMQTSFGQVCSNPNNIFGINGSGQIYPINISTAHVGSQINTATYGGAAANQANAVGFNPVNGLFYYFQVNPGAGTQVFVSYDPVHNTYATLASSPTSTTVHAGCVNFNGSGYYCDDVNGVLYYYNISANSWITITSSILDQGGSSVSNTIKTQSSGDMAIDGYGNLWLLPSGNSNFSLYKISAPLPTTPQATVTAKQIIAPTTSTPGGSAFQGIAFNASGQIFMATGDNTLYELKNTSTLVSIGTLSTAGVGNDLTSCSFPFGTLAVEWSSFTAVLEDNKVSVNWSISGSTNLKGFYVERSTDNKYWKDLTYVEFNQADENYSSLDYSPAPGTNYYRIREEDINGSVSYSNVKTVNLTSSTRITVWPNPARDMVYIQNNGTDNNTKSELFDQFGRMISSSVIHSGGNTLNVASLPAGNYILHMQAADGTVFNDKIVKK